MEKNVTLTLSIIVIMIGEIPEEQKKCWISRSLL